MSLANSLQMVFSKLHIFRSRLSCRLERPYIFAAFHVIQSILQPGSHIHSLRPEPEIKPNMDCAYICASQWHVIEKDFVLRYRIDDRQGEEGMN